MMRWALLAIVTLVTSMIFLFFTPEHAAMKRLPALAQWVDFDAFPPLPEQPLRFPRDHGGHCEAPIETWQVQGILTTLEGRRLGFQLHVFALGLRPGNPERLSAWGAHRYFLAYFTRTDLDAQAFQAEHRQERAALGLSGADDHRVWVDDWALDFDSDSALLRAGQRGNYLELTLQPPHPPHSPSENRANLRVYHLHRLIAQGLWGTEPVTGSAWLEHAWGMLPLPGAPVSLQRFQVQMEDGRDLFCLQIQRRGSNTPGPVRCLLQEFGGQPRNLADVRVTAVSHRRIQGKHIYPIAWRLESPALNLDLKAVIPNQVINGPLTLWSGWVKAQGRKRERGEGFVQVFDQAMER